MGKMVSVQVGKTSVVLEELTVEEAEGIALEYTPEELRGGQTSRFSRDLVAYSVRRINGVPVEPGDPRIRTEFGTLKKFSALERGFSLLHGLDDLAGRLATAVPVGEGMELEVSGRRVGLRPLTLDEDEKLELKGKYSPAQFLQARHDRIAASIAAVDGVAVGEGFNARVEIPLYRDWALLGLAYDRLNSDQESAVDFLPGTPG